MTDRPTLLRAMKAMLDRIEALPRVGVPDISSGRSSFLNRLRRLDARYGTRRPTGCDRPSPQRSAWLSPKALTGMLVTCHRLRD
ncbi:hypothetical protein [Piscinibacterium candidicorallinum]|uniref:Uncharacterized protein n=1 Tax=Piscinibacterium candidicorallinum TaxID=1793872 RepID=A0ABV7H541_9BURK